MNKHGKINQIDAEDWQMRNANTNANKIEGSVDRLKIQSELSYSDSQSQSRNIGMSINPITKAIGVEGGIAVRFSNLVL